MNLKTLICVAGSIFVFLAGTMCGHAEIVNLAEQDEIPAPILATIKRDTSREANTLFLGLWQPKKSEPVVLLDFYVQNESLWLQIWEKRGTPKKVRYLLQQTIAVATYSQNGVGVETRWADGAHQTPTLVVNLRENEGDGMKYVLAFANGWKKAPAVLNSLQYYTTESPFAPRRSVSIWPDKNGDLQVDWSFSDPSKLDPSSGASGSETEAWKWHRQRQSFVPRDDAPTETPSPIKTPAS